jgi:hypothetical protein
MMFKIVFAIYVLVMLSIFSLAQLATQAFENTNTLYVSVYGSVDESSNTDKVGGDSTIIDCKKGYQQKGNECVSVCLHGSQGNYSDECVLSKHCFTDEKRDTDGYNCVECPSGYYNRNTQKCTDTLVGGSDKNTSVPSTGNNMITPPIGGFNNNESRP